MQHVVYFRLCALVQHSVFSVPVIWLTRRGHRKCLGVWWFVFGVSLTDSCNGRSGRSGRGWAPSRSRWQRRKIGVISFVASKRVSRIFRCSAARKSGCRKCGMRRIMRITLTVEGLFAQNNGVRLSAFVAPQIRSAIFFLVAATGAFLTFILLQ